MSDTSLRSWGADSRVLDLLSQHPDFIAGRVITQERGQYTVATAHAELPAVLTGKLLYHTDDLTALPGVGDWVLLAGDDSLAVIHDILPRSSAIVRKAAGTVPRGQVIATNVDIVFICMAMNEDFNLRRLERCLAVVWESGATPMIVLTKADLAPDREQMLQDVRAIAIGANVLVTAAIDRQGLEALQQLIGETSTIAFIGSSGVGKSTLVNALVGEQLLRTSGLRNDGQGRHTTTHREAVRLPGGGVLIDTPGMRELGLDGADIDRTFQDIEQLAVACRFADCRHESEPGCAVQAAITRGELDADRLASHRRLSAESSYAGKSSREIQQQKFNRLLGGKTGAKAMREKTKAKGSGR